VSRRLLALATASLALLIGAGCADDVSPAARLGDVRISESDLLDEVKEWAGNEALLTSVQFPADLVPGAGPDSYSTQLVDFVLGSRVSFELHRIEFDERGLKIDDAVRQDVESQLFGDQTELVMKGLSEDYRDQLIDDVCRRLILQQELGDEGYNEWLAEAGDDVEVNPRYGSWDAESSQVLPPFDPAAPAASDVAAP
jgi:hypothetical protein